MGQRNFFSIHWFIWLFIGVIGEKTGDLFSEEVERLIPYIIATLPHDPSAFTQGLVIHQDVLYESTGQYGKSSLRCIDLQTGKVLEKIQLAPNLFGEGLTCWQDYLIQLTWKEGIALVYQRHPLTLLYQLSYKGEGWGLCADESSLLMTNGSSQLIQRKLPNFAIEKVFDVYLKGEKISYLNDLICVGNDIYANVWRTDYIVRIDKKSGNITALIDASALLPAEKKASLGKEAVLNGIAYRPSSQTFFLTGKYWPLIFEVRFVAQNQ